MADIVFSVLRVVAEIEENSRQASYLVKRVAAIERPMLAIKQGTRLASSESLS